MTSATDKTEHVKTIRELLGLEGVEFSIPVPEPVSKTSPPPAFELPVAEPQIGSELVVPAPPAPSDTAHEPEAVEFVPAAETKSKVGRFLSRDAVRYPLIFIISLGFFYVVLNFHSLSQQFFGAVTPPPSNEQSALGSKTADFISWISRYYVVENKPEIIAANSDPDADGLTNLDEYYLSTNPFRRDTDRDGIDDGQEVLAGDNPLYDGGQTSRQQEVVAKSLDLGAVDSRRSYNSDRGLVGGESTSQGTVDTESPGAISIPRLGLELPVIWSKTFEGMEEDLKYGVAHHPSTPYPGSYGTVSIHGHSSGNWDDGGFKTAFTKINLLEPGDEVFVTVHYAGGQSRRYRYLVRSKKVYAKTDGAQFHAGDGYFLNLSTSWPIGTSRERYVVTTELAGL